MIGIFGGTFDPIHYGHLRPVREVMVAMALEVVRFIPAAQPPHREAPIAGAAQRLRMVELALTNEPGFLVDEREMHRPGPSYTVDTLSEMRAECDDTPLCLLLGMDAFEGLEGWHEWQRLFELAHLVVMTRPGWRWPSDGQGLPAWARARLAHEPASIAERPAGRLCFVPVIPEVISATEIRKACARGEDIDQWVPPAVRDYIQRHGLYRTTQR